MTKDKEHEAKMHRDKAKVKTKHVQEREAHVEEKVESEPIEAADQKKSREDVNQAAARIVREATED
jgi:hypothetical protein